MLGELRMEIKFVHDLNDYLKDKIFVLKWGLRRIKKILFNEKINLVFLCHRPNVWGSLLLLFQIKNNYQI